MIHPIMKDQIFLAQPSQPATVDDLQIGLDLLETLQSHQGECVGMAANMIGFSKNIIAVCDDDDYILMFNPKIVKEYKGVYPTEEGCLSLEGVRFTMRREKIKVEWQNLEFQTRIKTFSAWTAQIIQHEIDHCNGIVI